MTKDVFLSCKNISSGIPMLILYKPTKGTQAFKKMFSFFSWLKKQKRAISVKSVGRRSKVAAVLNSMLCVLTQSGNETAKNDKRSIQASTRMRLSALID